MMDGTEKIAKLAYRNWIERLFDSRAAHPDEEMLAGFLEKKLSAGEYEDTLAHLAGCKICLEKISTNIKSSLSPQMEVPPELIRRAKEILPQAGLDQPLEIVLRVKDKMLELVNSTGDILFGQELLPAPVLRSRRIKDFKDEVTILKDFAGIRVEIRVENKPDSSFNVTVKVKDKQTGVPIKDFRVTLIKEETELESYIAKTGAVIFEHVSLGKYAIEITSLQEKLASVSIDIRR
ncbi:MAG: hypothetical protein NTU54_08535 [Candidatus Omnitrophica bacterium]|nr:hypothetical protein [Candidatus Omnitrophota bacterium]